MIRARMTIDEGRRLYNSVKELTAALAELGIIQLEVVASGKPPRYLVSGFAADAAAETRIAEALEAVGTEVENDVVPVACRRSGPAPSSLDGDPAASAARRQVRDLLDQAAVCRADNDYVRAIKLSRQAEAIAKGANEPALEALTWFALGYYMMEGEGFHREVVPPETYLKGAAQLMEGSAGVDPILSRNIARMVARLSARTRR